MISSPKSDLIDMIVRYGQLKCMEGLVTGREGRRGCSEKFHAEALLKLEQIEDVIYNEL